MLRRVTRLLPVSPEAVAEAARVIRGGGLVAFPTETVYGLGANALDGAAVRRIYAAKGRPADNPLIAHVAGEAMLRTVAADVNERARRLIRAFWPGALTLILPKAAAMPDAVTCGLPTVAVREPSGGAARALITAAGVPIAAPSANLSGKPSPTNAAHVLADLDGRVDIILDGGPCGIGVESAIADVTGPPRLLRPGGVARGQIEEALGEKLGGPREAAAPIAPGMKYRHYAPAAPLTLVDGGKREFAAIVEDYLKETPTAAVLCYDETAALIDAPGAAVLPLGGGADEAAANLFAALRRCDELNVPAIFAEAIAAEGIGEAVMNRLRKAANR